MEPTPAIVHMDMDTFFVSVERLRDPQLVGLPVMVGGSSDRGVVASCSYEARQYGIHAGMAMRQARRLCPQAVVVGGHFSDYVAYSQQVREIVAAQVPVYEFASIDEFYLDLTGMDRYFGTWPLAQALRRDIMHKTKLPISMGMATSKTVAKIATGQAKPCGELRVPPGDEKIFLAPLPIGKVPGAGEKAVQALRKVGLVTLHDVQQSPPEVLEQVLGKWGLALWHKAHGRGSSELTPYHERKSIGVEETFATDSTDVPAMEALITAMVEKVAYRMRRKAKLAGCVTIKLRYYNFETTSRQGMLPPTALDEALIPHAKALFNALYDHKRPVRLLGVQLSHLMPGLPQLDLFLQTSRRTQLTQALDNIKERYGSQAVVRGSTLNAWERSRLASRYNIFRGESDED